MNNVRVSYDLRAFQAIQDGTMSVENIANDRYRFLYRNCTMETPSYGYRAVCSSGLIMPFTMLDDDKHMIQRLLPSVKFKEGVLFRYFCTRYERDRFGNARFYAVDPLNTDEQYTHIFVRAKWDCHELGLLCHHDYDFEPNCDIVRIWFGCYDFVIPIDNTQRLAVADEYRRKMCKCIQAYGGNSASR